jgi:hypothetical protein
MPPLVWCAASSVVSSDSQEKKRRYRSHNLEVNAHSANPLLERFLQQQQELIAVPTLRQDLMAIRRAGFPTEVSGIPSAIFPPHIPWAPAAPPMLNGSNFYIPTDNGISINVFTESHNYLSFSDYNWANIAIHRTRIEAMYI